MPQVIGVGILRRGAAITRREILQEFDAGTARCSQATDAQARAGDVVQMLLLGAAIHAFTGEPHAEYVAIKLETVLRVRYHERGVVDAEE